MNTPWPATLVNPATDIDAPRPSEYIRRLQRRKSQLLELVAQAAAAGNAYEATLHAATLRHVIDHLKDHRIHAGLTGRDLDVRTAVV